MKLEFERPIPVLPARLNENGDVLVWCQYCCKEHIHGKGSNTGGHKVAHCYVRTSPYLDTGYIIGEIKPWDPHHPLNKRKRKP